MSYNDKQRSMLKRLTPATLHGRLVLGALLSTTVSLLVFACTVFVFVVRDELNEHSDQTPSQVNWEVAGFVLQSMAVAMPLGLVIAAGGSYWLSRRVLAPIDQVVRFARDVTAQDLDQRLPIPDTDDELKDLVLAQNALFERLSHGFRALNQFASDASHELRTPLAIISNELEVALRRPRTPEEWRGAAERSLDELRRLHQLVEALIELARADAESHFGNGYIDPRILVVERCDTLASHAASCGIDLSADVGTDERNVLVQGSAEALRVALSNLVSNALRYTPRGGHVYVSVDRLSGNRVAIHVDDTGTGVDIVEMAAIFAPFARGARGRAVDAQGEYGARGLGLGLSIAKRIVERHGGTIAVTQSPKGGARFSVELPVSETKNGMTEP